MKDVLVWRLASVTLAVGFVWNAWDRFSLGAGSALYAGSGILFAAACILSARRLRRSQDRWLWSLGCLALTFVYASAILLWLTILDAHRMPVPNRYLLTSPAVPLAVVSWLVARRENLWRSLGF